MRFTIILTALFLIACFSTQEAFAGEITIAADRWCPINCEPNSSMPGIMIEIAKKIFQEKGHRINYIIYPWKRAVLLARKGEIDGIIGAFNGDAPDFFFPQNEQITLKNSFFVLKDNVWNYSGPEALQNITLGFISGYDYGPILNNYIKTAPKDKILLISGSEGLSNRLFTLLKFKRVDVIVETDLVLMYELKKTGKQKQVRYAGDASQKMKAYIAFSPNSSKSLEYSKILSDGMIGLKRSGELDKIIKKYTVEK
jgi:polar amino acid transport system substrate-binding protein